MLYAEEIEYHQIFDGATYGFGVTMPRILRSPDENTNQIIKVECSESICCIVILCNKVSICLRKCWQHFCNPVTYTKYIFG